MKTAKDFCTCRDKNCPLNPVNHSSGCDLCIQKCLKLGEIPSCFFNEVCNIDDTPGYAYKDFAKMVLKQK
ncbi:MAG: DUF6485 family protein [Clostridiales bacterium]|nr:DUF6485 family protein [Clostridiales bacterium]